MQRTMRICAHDEAPFSNSTGGRYPRAGVSDDRRAPEIHQYCCGVLEIAVFVAVNLLLFQGFYESGSVLLLAYSLTAGKASEMSGTEGSICIPRYGAGETLLM